MGSAQRVLLLIIAALIMAGVWLTGFEQAHWFFYVVVGLLIFAAASGFCVTYSLLKKLGLK